MRRLALVHLAVVTVLVCVSWPARAQDRPVVFVHGFFSSGESWAGAAARLQDRLAISATTPSLPSRELFETQATDLQRQLGSLGVETIAVAHSNGGIVSREWSRRRPLSTIVTIGTPHGGVPLVSNLYAFVGFNQALIGSFNNVYRLFGQGCCSWQWILTLYNNVWQAVVSASVSSVPRVASAFGLNATVPVSFEMQPNSSYLVGLNSPANLAREATAVPARVGIVSTAHNFYYGGILRAAFPDDGDTIFYLRELARFGLETYASYIFASAAFSDWSAFDLANGMMTAAFYLRYMDEVWCRTVSVVGLGVCWANDTLVPSWSQVYPNGGYIDTGWEGPAHTQETRMSDALLEQALTIYAGVRPRIEGPPVPPPGPPTDPGSGGNPPADVVIYEHTGFSGAELPLSASQSYIGSTWNDRMSSLHVPNGRTVVLYEHADFGGSSLELTADVADLRDYPGPGLDGTWNDAVSAVEIR